MTSATLTHLAAAAAPAPAPHPAGPEGQLIIAALAGIAVIVVLIIWLKLHPFLSLLLGSLVAGLVAGMAADAAVGSFITGFGATMGSVGILVALGAMYGKLLADSGGGAHKKKTKEKQKPQRLKTNKNSCIGSDKLLANFF
ncbi:MAG: GntT/GntP/DsdX family permease, partial [Leifsonia sp.]